MAIIFLIDIIIFLTTAILLVVLTTQINEPLNLGVDALIILILLAISSQFNQLFSWFTAIYFIWMVAVVAFLYWYRQHLRL
ncbi:hypothetical protein [Lacticaseibacillus saniviri]|uniref:Uncharacterized protein n=1 Tax=Lacticaseibacillus saniviri JCM 17471 = DSM 24301 TaxID=1293598 RepID=A0A0R2MYG4_9LACO|nr:hypothetical protein [Lacticaseibacillus saniviri]KRO18565.1 hypothetical protein IV56_GL000842 [Lacticaseibacillus saniviri JCM 17471 = DSM 24301]MCG4281537.1 hypothetical protein [Lacticaseibacillus saniviri]